MGDRSYCSAYVYAITEGTADEVRAALLDSGMDCPYEADGSLEQGGLRLGQQYINEELLLGEGRALGEALHQLGASFVVRQSAHYTSDGEIIMGTPTLGLFISTMSEYYDSPVVHAYRVEEVIAATTDRDELIAELRALTGKAWKDELDLARDLIEADPDRPGDRVSRPFPVTDEDDQD